MDDEDRDKSFATIALELGLTTQEHVERAHEIKQSGDGRPLGKIFYENGWIDEAGYLRVLDAQRARAALDRDGLIVPARRSALTPPGPFVATPSDETGALPPGDETPPFRPDAPFSPEARAHPTIEPPRTEPPPPSRSNEDDPTPASPTTTHDPPTRPGRRPTRLIPPEEPTEERIDLEKKRKAARAAVQRGALVAEAQANAQFLRQLMGAKLGATTIDKLVAKGPMVFSFHGTLDGGLPVTVKVLRADMVENPRALARFDRECHALARLGHPSIARIVDHGEHRPPPASDGEPQVPVRWISIERDEGETLAERLQREPLEPDEASVLGRDVALGLDAAHRAGLVHRDVRPESIFISNKGGVRLVDFAVARDEEAASITFKGQILGSPEYAAPELASGPALPPSDVYALGITLFRAVTGQLPFQSKNVVRLYSLHATATIPRAGRLNPRIPDKLTDLITRMLAKKPGDRPTMADVAAALGTSTKPADPCVACGIPLRDEEVDEHASVPLCTLCLSDVASKKRCTACLHPAEDGAILAARLFCMGCAARVKVACPSCTQPAPLAALAQLRRAGHTGCPRCQPS